MKMSHADYAEARNYREKGFAMSHVPAPVPFSAYDVMEDVSRANGFNGAINPEFLSFVRDYKHGWESLAAGSGHDALLVRGAYGKVMDDARALFAPVGGWRDGE